MWASIGSTPSNRRMDPGPVNVVRGSIGSESAVRQVIPMPIRMLHTSRFSVMSQRGGVRHGKKWDPDAPMSNIGCSHIAFATENCIDELYEELVAKGINFISPPQEVEEEGEVIKFCYFKDPDGVTLELIGS